MTQVYMPVLFFTGIVALTLISCDSLKKVTHPSETALTGTYWKLVELNGQSVVPDSRRKEAYLLFSAAENRVSGNSSCNNMSGSYTTETGNRLRFGPMAATKMACEDMETEMHFFRALEMTDRYFLKGDTLQLIRAKMAPLARLVAVKR